MALLGRFVAGKGHLDHLLEEAALGRQHWLVMEVFRQWLVIEALLAPHLQRPPRPQAINLLRLAVAELLAREAACHPRIVHHAGEVAHRLGLSRAEAGFVNAVLRAVLRAGWGPAESRLEASHPDWLRRRWERQFGREAMRALLRWNQAVPQLTFRAAEPPPYAEPTPWAGFYTIRKGAMPAALADARGGRIYLQDPFTRVPVELLQIKPGETVLDLCAAPGGKSRQLAERLAGTGRLVAVDRPGPRLQRLRANLAHAPAGRVEVVACAVAELEAALAPLGLQPGACDAVLIDVPCSNTGVMQKRPDVKLRLREADIPRLAAQQLALLEAAARWPRPGGCLVYSTCSLEQEENAGVIEAFLRGRPDWRLQQARISLPWECGHDGGGAFLLTRAAAE